MRKRKLNIYLVGLPGSGKTTIGKVLAKKLHKDFFDLDCFLIKQTGVSINTIFDLEGEAGFRKRENRAIETLTAKHNIVLATGGGSILNQSNRELLKNTGLVIYLKIEPNFLMKRLEKDTSRPLLQQVNLLNKLTSLYQERSPLYNEVSHEVYLINEKTSSFHSCIKELTEIIEGGKCVK